MQFSEKQQTAIATAITILSAVVIVAAVGAILLLMAIFVRRFSGVLMPLVVAAVAALVFHPYYQFFREKLRWPTLLALAAVFLSALIPTIAFFWFFGALVVHQVSDLVQGMPAWWEEATLSVHERWPRFQVLFEESALGQQIRAVIDANQEEILQRVQSFGSRALSAGFDFLKGLGALLGWAVLPVYFAFFLMADPGGFEKLDRLLPFLKPETRKDVIYLANEFVNMIVAFFRGQLIIAFLQGVLFAIGFSLVGLRYGFILGLVLGFLNIIPYLGSMVGLGVTLPLAFFQAGGGFSKLVWVLVIFTLVQMIEGYVLTPKIMGDRTGLHPLVIIVAIFFWGSALGGILGMILAIPLTAFLVVFWRLAEEKYIGELV